MNLTVTHPKSGGTDAVPASQTGTRDDPASRHQDVRGWFGAVPLAMALVRLQSPTEGEILLVSPKLEQLFGYGITGIPTLAAWWEQAFPEEGYRREIMAAWSRRMLAAEGKRDMEPLEGYVTCKDGSRRFVECRGAPMEDGRLHLVTFLDQTDRRRAEEDTRVRHQALEACASALVLTDVSGKILWVNAAFEKLTGYSLEEVKGQLPRVLRSARHDAAFYQAMWLTILAGKTWAGELFNRRKDGTIYQEEMTITPCHDAAGNITHFIAFKADITDRKKLEAQYYRAQRMETIGALASGIAHDLNNVLAPVLMAVSLLRETSPPEEREKLLQILDSSARRGGDLIKQVLAFSRGVANQALLLQPMHLIKEFRKLVETTFPKSITLDLRLSRQLSAMNADPTQIHQVLMNLCLNARDAMPHGGHLIIEASDVDIDENYAEMTGGRKPGRYVVITVKDTGSGIPPAILPRIFDPFFTTKDPGKGTGLGLPTSQAIVKGHGGFMTVYSEPERGATFKVYLPAAASEAPPATAIKVEELPRGHSELVLVVDDEALVRNVCRRTLQQFGYRVITAENGAEAVSLYLQHRKEVAVVLTDMMMPVMDGAATIVALRNVDPGVKVICASGLGTDTAFFDRATCQPDAVLAKPYTASLLLESIHRVLTSVGITQS